MRVVKALPILVLVGLILVILPASSQAAAIVGGIAFGGNAYPDTGDWDTATAVNFGSSVPNASVSSVVGDYTTAGIAEFDTATFFNFGFAPILSPSPVQPLWQLTDGQASFDLENAQIISQEGNALVLKGTGTLNLDGYDPTPGLWDFSAQQTGGVVFSFSATNAAAPVPEPASLALLGLGLIGIAGAARIRRNKN